MCTRNCTSTLRCLNRVKPAGMILSTCCHQRVAVVSVQILQRAGKEEEEDDDDDDVRGVLVNELEG